VSLNRLRHLDDGAFAVVELVRDVAAQIFPNKIKSLLDIAYSIKLLAIKHGNSRCASPTSPRRRVPMTMARS
jgi:hypothetical protein